MSLKRKLLSIKKKDPLTLQRLEAAEKSKKELLNYQQTDIICHILPADASGPKHMNIVNLITR